MVKNDRNIFEILALYANEEIQSWKIQNSIYVLNFPTPFSAEFPGSQDKRVGILLDSD